MLKIISEIIDKMVYLAANIDELGAMMNRNFKTTAAKIEELENKIKSIKKEN